MSADGLIQACMTNGMKTSNTVKTVPTEIQSPKLAEIKSVYVAFHVHTQLQQPMTEIYSLVQSFSN